MKYCPMRKQLLNNLILTSLFLLSLFWASPGLHALSTDKDQDIEVESDTAVLDDSKNISIYTGNVIVVQGSMRITGDKMTVYYTDDREMDRILVVGNPATFRQLPDNNTVYDEAEARTMEYYETSSLLILTEEAFVKHDGNRLTGARIEYDTELSQVRAQSKGIADGNDKVSDEPGEDGRVKLIIPAKKSEPAP